MNLNINCCFIVVSTITFIVFLKCSCCCFFRNFVTIIFIFASLCVIIPLQMKLLKPFLLVFIFYINKGMTISTKIIVTVFQLRWYAEKKKNSMKPNASSGLVRRRIVEWWLFPLTHIVFVSFSFQRIPFSLVIDVSQHFFCSFFSLRVA